MPTIDELTAIIQECYDSGHIHVEYLHTYHELSELHAYCKRRAGAFDAEVDYVRAITEDGEFLTDSRYLA